MVAGLTCIQSGVPALSVSYDTSLAMVGGPWTSGSYSQINPADFDSAMSAAGL